MTMTGRMFSDGAIVIQLRAPELCSNRAQAVARAGAIGACFVLRNNGMWWAVPTEHYHRAGAWNDYQPPRR